MNQTASPIAPEEHGSRRRRWTWVLALCAIGVVWYAALCVDSATRLAATTYLRFQADLPWQTLLLFDAVKHHLTLAYALACTALLAWVLFRARAQLIPAIALLMALTAVCASVAAFSLWMPASKCGDFWPDWPGRSAAVPPGVVQGEDGRPDRVAAGTGAPLGKCAV